MNTLLLSSLADPSRFTGLEHTRIIDLLSTLALVSIAMWIVVSLSIVIRLGALLTIKRLAKRVKRNLQLEGGNGR